MHPDADIALLQVASPASVQLPEDHRLAFYNGAAPELRFEPELTAFGFDLFGDRLASAVLPPFVLESGPPDAARRLFLGAPGPFEAQELSIPRGSPALTANGFLSGVAVGSTDLTVRLRDVAGEEFDRRLTVHEHVPLTQANVARDDARRSATHWIRQVMGQAELRDADGSGHQDLWGFRKDTLQPVALLRSPQGVAPSPVGAGPEMDRDGGWRLVGRTPLGGEAVAMVWREAETGEIELWKMERSTRTGRLSFHVEPSWDIRAVGDVDGDGRGDLVWSNDLTGHHFFWLMNGFDEVDLGEAQANPAQLIRYGQWLAGPWGLDEDEPVDIVGAGYFEPLSLVGQVEPTGREQVALDLVWKARSSADTFLWEMRLELRECEEIDDPSILQRCDQGVQTYELSRNMARLPLLPAYWKFAGAADFDNDGRTDMAWHAAGDDAPDEERGRVLFWLFDEAAQAFNEVVATDQTGAPLVIDPDAIELAGG